MQARTKDAIEEKVWLRRSHWTLQSYCLLPRDIWQQLRLESTLKHARQENKERSELASLSGARQGTDRLVK